MRKIKSFLICLVTVYLVVFSKPISALSIINDIDDSDYYLGSNVSMIENTIELNIGEKLKNIDVLNCFRIKMTKMYQSNMIPLPLIRISKRNRN